jgi:hypothetical protein
MPEVLSFGLRTAPADRPVWGARLIWPGDLVHDRQSTIGEDVELQAMIAWLNAGPLREALRCARLRVDRDGNPLGPTEDREVTLYEDERGIVRANPQGSRGYLYVAAWLK